MFNYFAWIVPTVLSSIQVDKTVASITATPDPMLRGKSRDANNNHTHYFVRRDICSTVLNPHRSLFQRVAKTRGFQGEIQKGFDVP